MNYEARFGGIGRLYGRSGLDILRNSRMAVVVLLYNRTIHGQI